MVRQDKMRPHVYLKLTTGLKIKPKIKDAGVALKASSLAAMNVVMDTQSEAFRQLCWQKASADSLTI
jgi:hypothetical protein